jgi:hypothetical protein
VDETAGVFHSILLMTFIVLAQKARHALGVVNQIQSHQDLFNLFPLGADKNS